MKYLFCLLFICLLFQTKAQESREVIQFTGVVMENDSIKIIQGVHVYIPSSGRGTTTNPYGFFSMPVLEGDSIIFTAVGFEKTHYIVPKHDPSISLKVIVTLKDDVTFLEEIQVFPFPSEETFKQAVITMNIPLSRDESNMQAWLQASYMQVGYASYPPSPSMTQRWFQDQQVAQFQRKFGSTNINLLNPFAWNSFIKSLKKK